MLNIMNPPADWSTMKKLIWLRGTPINGGEELTVTGTPPLTLPNSLGKPLKAWEVGLLPYQEGTGDPSPSNVRPIHGTDKVSIYTDSKYGGLVEWNQQIQNGNFADGTTTWNISAQWKSSEVVDNVLHLVSTQNQYDYINIIHSCPNIVGHKYFGSLRIKASKATRVDMSVGAAAGHGLIINGVSYNADTWNLISGIGSPDAYTTDMLYIRPKSTIDEEEVDVYITDIFCCDLTQMFGAGNEPSTVEEFRALFPKDYYPYNSGQQMTVDQVNGAQYSPAVITLPQTVYTATISEQGGESRWGEVDLGTLNWIVNNEDAHIFACNPPNIKPVASGDYTGRNKNAICEAYKPSSNTSISSNMDDFGWLRTGTQYFVRDTNYSTLSDFVASVSGVKLIYELENPVQFPLTAPTIPTPTGTATAWATAEDGTVESMEVTYVGKA